MLLLQVSDIDLQTFMDEFNHHIFEMVSSADVNEKKGGILAISEFRILIMCTARLSLFSIISGVV